MCMHEVGCCPGSNQSGKGHDDSGLSYAQILSDKPDIVLRLRFSDPGENIDERELSVHERLEKLLCKPEFPLMESRKHVHGNLPGPRASGKKCVFTLDVLNSDILANQSEQCPAFDKSGDSLSADHLR